MILFDSEKSLERFVVRYFEDNGICIIDNANYTKCLSQFSFGEYGVPDLVFCSVSDLDGDLFVSIHVIELKNEQIKLKDIAQISRYRTYIDIMSQEEGFETEIKCSLVVPEGIKSNSDACYLVNACQDLIDVYEFSLDPMSGIKFNLSHGYHKEGVSKKHFDEIVSLTKTGF